MTLSPIILFAYNRFHHLKKTIDSLTKNKQSKSSDLIIFSDAARVPEEQPKVEEVRTYLKSINGFKSITIHYRTENFGLAKSIIEGVSQVLSTHDRVIVLEDDMVTSPHFLSYMNEGLDRYEKNHNVISIHGYVYPIKQTLPEAFFLRGADCWGWATWRRGWELFNPDGEAMLNELKRRKLIKAFDFNNTYAYSKMLREQIKGRNDSWAIRWYASAFLANKLTLYPGRSLVHNIGHDSTGTHCSYSDIYDVALTSKPIDLSQIEVIISSECFRAFEVFFKETQISPIGKILRFLKKLIDKTKIQAMK